VSPFQPSARKPNLFLVGVAKAGTTSLHIALDRHPDVFMSTPKEPHFLSAPKAAPEAAHILNATREEGSYLDLFASAVEPIAGESSTSYWWDERTAERIAGFSPGARVIIALRDPVQRAYSHYLNDTRDAVESRPFAATLPARRPGPDALRFGDPLLRTELGFYAERLSYYLDVFGERAHVVVFEDFQRDPDAVLDGLLSFLELPPAPERLSPAASSANRHRMPRGRAARSLIRSPAVRRGARALLPHRLREAVYESMLRPAAKPELPDSGTRTLVRLYDEDTAAVEGILGRSLPWSTSSSAR
jgi:hypothetical protein